MSSKKKCINCGLLIDDDLDKCPYCGSSQDVKNKKYEDETDYVEIIKDEKPVEKTTHFLGNGQKLSIKKQIWFFILGLVIINAISSIYVLICNFISPGFLNTDLFSLIGNCGIYTLIFFIFLLIANKDLKLLFKKFTKGRTYLFGIGYGLLIIIFSLIYSMITQLIYNGAGDNTNQSAIVQLTSAYPISSIIVLGIIGPICEEFTYRVGLFGLIRRKTKVLAYVIVGIIFGLIHFNFGPGIDMINELLQLPEYIITGLLLCYIYDKEGVETSIVAHCLNNLTSLIIIVINVYAK